LQLLFKKIFNDEVATLQNSLEGKLKNSEIPLQHAEKEEIEKLLNRL